jgi:hypothetical protein
MEKDTPDLWGENIHLPITSHRPPEPFGSTSYKHAKTPGVTDISPETVGHLLHNEFTFARHPRERHEPSLFPMPDWFIDNQTANLRIVDTLSTDKRGAQVVLCDVYPAPTELWKRMGHSVSPSAKAQVVAKIFDPLHYDSPDTVAEADLEYAQEAAAYIHMHGQRKEPTYANKPNLVPRFYGTWTTDVTLNHIRKSFVPTALRKDIKSQEAKDRAAFDAAAAAAKEAGASSQTTKLEPQKFRPVRIILLQYIEGSCLSKHLICRSDPEDRLKIEPTPEFVAESKRLVIMGSIMDTVSRIEHLGIKPVNIGPSNFMITETPRASGSDPEYNVVMTDFSMAYVGRYTRMGYILDEKLPRPMHPLSSRHPQEWYDFLGWIPEKWLTEDGSYEAWGQSYFNLHDYSLPDVIKQVCDSVGWGNDMRAAGNMPLLEDDPRHLEKLRELFKHMPEWETMTYDNKHNFKSKDDYDKFNEATRETIRERRAKADAERRKEMEELARKVERQQVRRAKKAKRAKKANKAAEATEVEQLEQELEAVHITGSSTDAPSDPHPTSSIATRDFQPSEPSRLRQPVRFDTPHPRDGGKHIGDESAMDVPANVRDYEDNRGAAAVPKQGTAASRASSSAAGRFKPEGSSLLRQVTEHVAIATFGRPRADSSVTSHSTLTSHSTSTKSSNLSSVFDEETRSQRTGSSCDDEVKGKDDKVKGKDDKVKGKDDKVKGKDDKEKGNSN